VSTASQKEKKGEIISERQHKKGIYLHKKYNPMAKVLGLHLMEFFTFERRKLNTQRRS
jgi:hypothetical protein